MEKKSTFLPYHRGLLKFVYILDMAAMAVRGSREWQP